MFFISFIWIILKSAHENKAKIYNFSVLGVFYPRTEHPLVGRTEQTFHFIFYLAYEILILIIQFCRFEELGVEFVKKPTDGKMKGLAFIKDPDGYWIEILSANNMKGAF